MFFGDLFPNIHYFVEKQKMYIYNKMYDIKGNKRSSMKEIILASASPRRSELLKQLSLDFKVLPSDVEESIDLDLDPGEIAEKLSYDKAFSVAKQISEGSISKSEDDFSCLVIGADTIVVKDGIMGKPQSEKEAYDMLKSLSGQWHEVITGITVVDVRTLEFIKGNEKTRVKMRELTDRIIYSYMNTGEPFDKAGAYGIQGMGAVLVEKIEGCYFNVVGLPIGRLSLILEKFGVSVL